MARHAVCAREKIEIMFWAVRAPSIPDYVNTVYPAERHSEEDRIKAEGGFRSWTKKDKVVAPSKTWWLEDFMRHVGRPALDVWPLMDCARVEFFLAIPEPFQEVARGFAPSADFARLEADIRAYKKATSPANAHDNRAALQAHTEIDAGLAFLRAVDAGRRGLTGAEPLRLRDTISWSLCVSLQSYLDCVLVDCEAIAMVTGPSIREDALQFDWPVVLAATGSAIADGDDAAVLSQFLADKSAGAFPQPPWTNPPKGERGPVEAGLILSAWRSDRLFEAAPPIMLGQDQACTRSVSIAEIQQHDAFRAMYLELCKATKAVQIFRIGNATTRARIVVSVDVVGDELLNDHQCAFILHGMQHALHALSPNGKSRR